MVDSRNRGGGRLTIVDALPSREAALAAAKKAADAGDFDQAVASSKEAEALAKASIFQATSEKEAWKALEIR